MDQVAVLAQWIKYVDNICWMRNTYYIPQEFSVPQGRDELHIDWELTYYQWVPIILGRNSHTNSCPHHIFDMNYHSNRVQQYFINHCIIAFSIFHPYSIWKMNHSAAFFLQILQCSTLILPCQEPTL